MALAIAGLLAGLWAGLLRLGWAWPPGLAALPMTHGPLMVCGFLGTLVSLERAVGLGKRWALLAPALAASGTLVALAASSSPAGPLLISAASLVLVLALSQLLRIHAGLDMATIVLAAGLWLTGNVAWLFGAPIPVVTLWWIGFLVATVAGERLELSRLLRLSFFSQVLFALAIALMVIAAVTGHFAYAAAVRMLGVALLGLAAWLLKYDIAWRRLKADGQSRFMALSLLSGYVWLAFGGALMLARGGLMAGPLYDAMLHSVFVGFVFTMIFAHAPIIFPAVLQLPVRYVPRFYAHLVLLHAGLVLRVAGDLIPWWPARLWGGLLNALVILLFLGNTISSIKFGPLPAAEPQPRRAPPSEDPTPRKV